MAIHHMRSLSSNQSDRKLDVTEQNMERSQKYHLLKSVKNKLKKHIKGVPLIHK